MKKTQPGTYLITGAASGIGAALAARLARSGQNVVLADINLKEAEITAASLGANAHAVELDICDAKAWDRVLDGVEARLGSLDVLVNNAAIVRTGFARNVAIADHQLTINTNFMGPLTGMLKTLERFRKQGRGHIVTVCSMTSFLPFAGLASYASSKHALRAFHDAVAVEERCSGIDFTIVHPTSTETPMLEQEAADDDAAMCFLAPSVTADEVAGVIVKAIRRKAVEVCMPQAQARTVKALGTNPKRLRAYADLMEEMGREGLAARRNGKAIASPVEPKAS